MQVGNGIGMTSVVKSSFFGLEAMAEWSLALFPLAKSLRGACSQMDPGSNPARAKLPKCGRIYPNLVPE